MSVLQICIILMELESTRLEGECKRDFYRRMASLHKDKYAGQFRQRDDHYRFHFMKREDEPKTKSINKISKHQPLFQQRIRNRMAAQQSRERHRLYVEELERKAKIYDQLVATQQLICKHCHQNLECDLSVSQEKSLSVSDREINTMIKQEQMLESYIHNQVIRIDNQGMSTPFGIFFLICVVAVVAISALQSPAGQNPSRILSADLVAQPFVKPQDRNLRNFAEFIKTQRSLQGEVCLGGERGIPGRKNLRSYTVPEEVGWRRVGEYICSAPEEATLAEEAQAVSEAKQFRDKQQSIYGKDWHRIQVSQCFRNIL